MRHINLEKAKVLGGLFVFFLFEIPLRGLLVTLLGPLCPFIGLALGNKPARKLAGRCGYPTLVWLGLLLVKVVLAAVIGVATVVARRPDYSKAQPKV